MEEILATFYVDKKFGSNVMEYRLIKTIQVTKTKVIITALDSDRHVLIYDLTWKDCKNWYKIDIEEIMPHRSRRKKIKKIQDNLNEEIL
jgi:hypothetical protein